MKYNRVCIEALAYQLPEETVTSGEIERRLAPLYERLRLPEGRLELMTGIRERRFWPAAMLPGEISASTAAKALQIAHVEPAEIGALVHASVCRDYLEPATACGVHHRLGLAERVLAYDVSNACLGILNGIVQLANMIELGQIEAGIVVGSETSRQLVETTIAALNADHSLTRESVKSALASLTIGSASAAVVLTSLERSRTGNRLLAATGRAHSSGHDLCHSGRDEAVAGGMQPLMNTDSMRLMQEGVAAGIATFDDFLGDAGWSRDDIDKTFCHQVGAAHRKLLLESLALTEARDFATFQMLGNTGSAALPVTMALGVEQGHLLPREHAALLGIGSGINTLMLAVDWQTTPSGMLPRGEEPAAAGSQDESLSPAASLAR
ncbi:MAG TPA: 3-oxoacyl-ACP synthase III [Pirellulales bacterium]|jgi:acyl-CoA:acyl-CoA alkyltransferase|nr:3-oxoacyl-ACP synthase III [Pirellulales bacterium]